ncbi:MAG: hypothetical protein A2W19_06215 [Spirochaetes bacterium RBG_16_49_21]|nr:MAG: hypothetical protein A2W19_06215 [Spirochaetes bacterium RBG_16_49_21]
MSVRTLQAIVGIFFLLLGFMGVLPDVDEGIFAISNRHLAVEVVFGLVELVCGIIMVFGLFTVMRRKMMYRASMVVLIFWILRMIFSRLIWGPPQAALASVLNWLLIISVESIVAASVWLLASTYNR